MQFLNVPDVVKIVLIAIIAMGLIHLSGLKA